MEIPFRHSGLTRIGHDGIRFAAHVRVELSFFSSVHHAAEETRSHSGGDSITECLCETGETSRDSREIIAQVDAPECRVSPATLTPVLVSSFHTSSFFPSFLLSFFGCRNPLFSPLPIPTNLCYKHTNQHMGMLTRSKTWFTSQGD